MNSTADHLVDEYLDRLDRELADLPRARRRELVQEISEHIAEARGDLPTQSEVEIRTLLDRLGDPADIALEAHERFGVQPRRSRWIEIAALILLLIGGILLPVIGWFVGVVLLWASEVWTTRDKLIGTLVVPGGLLVPLGLGLVGVYEESCVEEFDPATNATTEVCTGGPSDVMQVVGPVLLLVLLAAPLVTTVYLARRMSRPPVSPAV